MTDNSTTKEMEIEQITVEDEIEIPPELKGRSLRTRKDVVRIFLLYINHLQKYRATMKIILQVKMIIVMIIKKKKRMKYLVE